MNNPSRRSFVKNSLFTASFLGLSACSAKISQSKTSGATGMGNLSAKGYGPLKADPNGAIRLPEGFSYQVISKAGETMDDGHIVPGGHDGMAAFNGPNGLTLIVRNHEMSPTSRKASPFANSKAQATLGSDAMYDAGHGDTLCLGGTSTLVYDTRTQELKRHYLSLTGTIRNCSGGPTPWGSWVTCEETMAKADENLRKDHGYNFEVPANAEIGLAAPNPLTEMGRFNHEAIAVDPASGIVYQTEDRPDGLIYRYIPNVRGQLSKGGRLQVLAIKGSPSRDTRNWDEITGARFPVNQAIEVEWIDTEDPTAPNDDLRYTGFKAGAARFARGEGMYYGNGEIYFACTNGGPKKFGQIFRYRPSFDEGLAGESNNPGKLELFIESYDMELLKACDNLTIAPWGDIVICEDDGGSSALVGITPEGAMYQIGHVDMESELAGACFSPDGTTLFVNIQKNPGQTLVITGPWRSRVG
jgi:uncharacterized protein